MVDPFTPSAPPVRVRKKPPTPPKKEESGLWTKILLWVFIVAGIGGIVTMIVKNPREPTLVCRNVVRGAASLTAFGSCTAE